MNQSTFSIIGERYLDTQHDDEYILALETELRRRGIVGLKRTIYEYIAASSFWWNILWWDWESLNETDVKIGWAYNLVLFGILSGVLAFTINPYVGICSFFVLHILTTYIGYQLRKGTKRNKALKEDVDNNNAAS